MDTPSAEMHAVDDVTIDNRESRETGHEPQFEVHGPSCRTSTSLSSLETPLDTALELLRSGFWPVAVKGKRPIGEAWGVERWTEGRLRATFAGWPEAGVGLMLGPKSGIIDIEIDGPDGEESLVKLFGGEIVDTLGWSSRRGRHRIFRYDPRLARLCKSKIESPELPGVEIRIGGFGAQFQSVCPPTVGLDGLARRWSEHAVVSGVPEAAYAFLERLQAKTIKPASANAPRARQAPSCDTTVEDSIPGPAYFEAALAGECADIAATSEGGRHVALRSAALRIASIAKWLSLDESKFRDRLAHAGRKCGLGDGKIQELLDFGWSAAEPRIPADSKLAVQEPNPIVRMHSSISVPSCMHTQENKESAPHATCTQVRANAPHANAHLIPKERHVGHSGFLESFKACGAFSATDIQGIVCKHAFAGSEIDWRRSIFNLCRELEPIVRKENWNELTWRAVSDFWLEVSLEASREAGVDSGLPDSEAVWCEFKKKRAIPIKKQVGDALARVKALIPHMEVHPDLMDTKYARLAKVMAAYAKENIQQGRTVFHVPSRDLAELAGLIDGKNLPDHKKALRWLESLSEIGFVSRFDAGTQGLGPNNDAGEYSWYGHPRPGDTVWNRNASRTKAKKRAAGEVSDSAHMDDEAGPGNAQPSVPRDESASSSVVTAAPVASVEELLTQKTLPLGIEVPGVIPRASETAMTSLSSPIADPKWKRGTPTGELEPPPVIPEDFDLEAFLDSFDEMAAKRAADKWAAG